MLDTRKDLSCDKRLVVLAVVKHDGLLLGDADESLCSDREVVLAAIKSDGRAIKYADDNLIAELKEEGLL